MKYLMLFEELKDFYQRELGLEKTDLIMVTTVDEKWLVWGYTIGNIKYYIDRNRLNLVRISEIEHNNEMANYGGWKSKSDAQVLIDMVNKGGYKGMTIGEEWNEDDFNNADIVVEDLKDKLKIVTYSLGAIRDKDTDLFS